jgi:hypothetical protein
MIVNVLSDLRYAAALRYRKNIAVLVFREKFL